MSTASVIAGVVVGFFLGLFGDSVRRNRDGRAQFHVVISDLRSDLEAAGVETTKFYRDSLPSLRVAVFQVRPFIKNWSTLYEIWEKYKNTNQNDFEWRSTTPKSVFTGEGKTANQNLESHLDEFDKCVGRNGLYHDCYRILKRCIRYFSVRSRRT
ncbi:MAG TPA: hypothetical protein VHG89_05960 [Verrucomicrobiae bacterium]|nr:hypothetical protein [Verrucomicrobiae bacterium]